MIARSDKPEARDQKPETENQKPEAKDLYIDACRKEKTPLRNQI
jgi:hypothetical protein